jgi:hypothetical protein
MLAHLEETRIADFFGLEILKGRHNLEDLDIDAS